MSIFCYSEMRMLREQETAMNKLKDRKARFEMRLSETQRIITEFKNRERMSDAPQYVEVFDQLKKRVEEFIAEVFSVNFRPFLSFRKAILRLMKFKLFCILYFDDLTELKLVWLDFLLFLLHIIYCLSIGTILEWI